MSAGAQRCLLVEVTAMPDVQYSLILGLLQAAAQADSEVERSYDFDKHVLFQAPGLVDTLPAWLAEQPAPDVLALSVYFWNRSVVIELARLAKMIWPGCLVVVGGNDVSYQTTSVMAHYLPPDGGALTAGAGR
jgi:hypothetical protein